MPFDTKLLVNILTGGKTIASPVKFANFYLIIDGNAAHEATNIVSSFKAFLAHVKSKFTVGKGGDTAFKTLPDGSFFNGFTSIVDTLKFIEEGI